MKRRARLDAVIFDMDGVVVDSELHWRLAGDSFFREIASNLSEEDSSRLIGLGVLDLYRFLSERREMHESQDAFLARCDRLAEEVYGARAGMSAGLTDLLADLRSDHVPLALASSSPRHWIRMTLDRFDLHAWFRTVVSSDDVGGESKPSPAIYQRAAALLGARAGHCVAIEDSPYGVLAAKRAGMRCLGFRTEFNRDLALPGADAEIWGFPGLSASRLRALSFPAWN